MSLLEELFGVDEAEEAEALERVLEGGSDNDERRGEDEAEEAEEDKRRVDPTKPKSVRIVKNPRVVLNPARLTGPRGLQALPSHFKDFKFKGKGHEAEDLDRVLSRLEHWAHRLYPKFQFDDCLKKIESLGKKRQVMVQLHKIRSDQIISDEIIAQRDSSDDETPAERPEPAPEDEEFDKLLAQQIELARATPGPASARKVPLQTPAGCLPLAAKVTSSPSINEEQKLRMLKNRQMAEERRLARMRLIVASTPNSNRQITDDSSDENIACTPTTNKGFDDRVKVVDLTDFNPAANLISTETNKCQEERVAEGIIDSTGDILTPKNVIQGSEKNISKEDIVGHVEDGMNNYSKNENKNTVRNNISDCSDVELEGTLDTRKIEDETNKMDTSYDDRLNTNGSKELAPLYYSDSSNDDCEVSNFNMSVEVEIHKTVASKKNIEDYDILQETVKENPPGQDVVCNNKYADHEITMTKNSNQAIIDKDSFNKNSVKDDIRGNDDQNTNDKENIIINTNYENTETDNSKKAETENIDEMDFQMNEDDFNIDNV